MEGGGEFVVQVVRLEGVLLLWYPNWRGSTSELAAPMMLGFNIFSVDFVPREVRATGLRSLSALAVLFLGMWMAVECYYSWGTVPVSKDLLKHLPAAPRSTSDYDHSCCLFFVDFIL